MRCAVWATADLPTPCLMEGRESWFEQGSNGCASCTAGVRPAVYCGRPHRVEVCCCSGVLCRLDDAGADLLYAGSVWPSSLAHRHVEHVSRDGMGLPTHTCMSFCP